MNEEFEISETELEIAAWLQDHPDFFTRHPDLAESLHIPHPCQPAVSLLAYQNRRLRERCQRLHDKLLEFVSIARDNDRLSERVQRLALGLLNGRSGMKDFLSGIEAILREEFHADGVALCLAAAPTLRSKIAAEFLCPEVVARFGGLFQTGQPHCGRLRPEQATLLFGEDATRVASAALIPISGRQWRGLLAVGSSDAERFHPGVGTLFLERIGELVSQALQGRLLDRRRLWVVRDAPSARKF